MDIMSPFTFIMMRVGVIAEDCIYCAFNCKSSLFISKKDWDRVNLNSDWCDFFLWEKNNQQNLSTHSFWRRLVAPSAKTPFTNSSVIKATGFGGLYGTTYRAKGQSIDIVDAMQTLKACLIVSPVVSQCALLAPRQLWPLWVPGQSLEMVVCNRHSLGSQSSEAWNLRIPLYALYTKHCHFRKVD